MNRVDVYKRQGDNLQGRKDHIAENGYKYLELADIS